MTLLKPPITFQGSEPAIADHVNTVIADIYYELNNLGGRGGYAYRSITGDSIRTNTIDQSNVNNTIVTANSGVIPVNMNSVPVIINPEFTYADGYLNWGASLVEVNGITYMLNEGAAMASEPLSSENWYFHITIFDGSPAVEAGVSAKSEVMSVMEQGYRRWHMYHLNYNGGNVIITPIALSPVMHAELLEAGTISTEKLQAGMIYTENINVGGVVVDEDGNYVSGSGLYADTTGRVIANNIQLVGFSGDNGMSQLAIYCRSESVPTLPTESTISSGGIVTIGSNTDGWQSGWPDGTGALYIATAQIIIPASGSSAITWSGPERISGLNSTSAYVSLQIYCRSMNEPTAPSDSTLNYEGVLQVSAYDSIWSTSLPEYDDDTTNKVYWCYPYHLLIQNYNSYQAKSRQASAVRVGRVSDEQVVIAAFVESAVQPGVNGIATIRVNKDLSISAVDGLNWTTVQPTQSIDPLWVAIFPAVNIADVVNLGTNGMLLESQYLWQVSGESVVNELALDTEYIDHSSDPTWYPIGSLSQFQSYFGTPSTRINSNNTKKFYLTADIDFAGQNYTNAPIASSSGYDYDNGLWLAGDTPFSGQFDGQGFAIRNLTVSRPDTDKTKLYGLRGLFGVITDGSVSNLLMDNCTVYGDGRTGGLVGSLLKGAVINCTNNGQINTGVYQDHIFYIGGLVGQSSTELSGGLTTGIVSLLDSYFSGSISYNNDANAISSRSLKYIGGIVGYASGISNITNCYSIDALISISTGQRDLYGVGGVAGYFGGSGIASELNCVDTTLSITHTTSWRDSSAIGGVIGDNSGTVKQSRSEADMIIDIFGPGDNICYTIAGGFVGTNNGSVSDCYSAGSISLTFDHSLTSSGLTSPLSVCGFVGITTNSNIYRCYSMSQVLYSSAKEPNYYPFIFGRSYFSNIIVNKCFSRLHAEYPGFAFYRSGDTNEVIEADMYDPATFIAAGWDFAGETANGTDDYWAIIYSGTSPILNWEKEFLAPYCKMFWDNSVLGGAVNPALILDLDDNVYTSDPEDWNPGAQYATLPITTYEVNGGRIWMACCYSRVPDAYLTSDISWLGPIRLESLDGADGVPGPVGARVKLWYNRSNNPAAAPVLPTTAEYNGWKSSLSDVMSAGQYIWAVASYIDSEGILIGFDDTAVRMSGTGGDTTIFRFCVSATVPDISGLGNSSDISGSGWYPQPPVVPSGSILWMIKADFSGVGVMISAGWSEPVPLSARDNIVPMYADSNYALDSVAWHSDFISGSDMWMKLSYDGGISWHGPFQIVGSPGQNGIGVAGPSGISTLFVSLGSEIPLLAETAIGTIVINCSNTVLTSSDGYNFGVGSVYRRTSSGWYNQGTLQASVVWAGSLITDTVFIGQDGSGGNDITIYGWDGLASTSDKSSYYTWGDIASALTIASNGVVTVGPESSDGGGFFGRLRYDADVYKDLFIMGCSEAYFGFCGDQIIRKGQFVGEDNIIDGSVNEVFDFAIDSSNEIELRTSPRLYELDNTARTGSFMTMFNFSLRTFVRSYWRTLLSFVTSSSVVNAYPSASTFYPSGYLTFLKSDGWFYIKFGSTSTDVSLVNQLIDDDVQVFTVTVGDQTFLFDMETVDIDNGQRKIYAKDNAQGHAQTYVRFESGQGFVFDGQTINGNLKITTYKNIIRAKTNNCRVYVPDEANIPPVFDQDLVSNPVKTLFACWLQSTSSSDDSHIYGKLRYNYRLWKIKK